MLPAILVSLCVVLRLVPHPANVAPLGAVAVFAGRAFGPRTAIPFVLVAMFLADAMLAAVHGYPLVSGVTPFVYAGFAGQALLGHALRRLRGGAVAAAVLGACLFFVVSNFGVWLAGGLYPHGSGGLAACYAAALPFFGASLAGDVVWTVVLATAYRPLAKRLSAKRGWVPRTGRDLALV